MPLTLLPGLLAALSRLTVAGSLIAHPAGQRFHLVAQSLHLIEHLLRVLLLAIESLLRLMQLIVEPLHAFGDAVAA